MVSRVFAYLQFLLPKYGLTALVRRVARLRNVRFKNWLIRKFVALYDVDTDEVKLAVPDDFATFNDFFIRELKSDARPVDGNTQIIVAPADGTVSSAGSIRADAIFQAKGLDYTLDDLLATDLDDARRYVDGSYATIYLAPYNYHRVHAPLPGELVAARYVPGDLFSVNAATVAAVPGLFRRNERLILHFDADGGRYALVFVGALNVGSISTPWSGELRPRKHGVVDRIDITGHDCSVAKGDLLGWFNMGSTVIVLLPPQCCEWAASLEPGTVIRMGEGIGVMTRP